MKPSELKRFLVFSIKHRFPILIKGAPGIGKSDIVAQACYEIGAELLISHPVVSDPTDYKGLPFAENGEARFLPFNDLLRLIKADKPLVFFLDDIGQAPPSVQAAAMQLILARRINGFEVSPFVTFIAATNRREDRAGVSGLLEPVKSRFRAIIELTVDIDDWCEWAIDNGQPSDLIAFNRFRPMLINSFKATNDLTNSPCPRTIAAVGEFQKAGIDPAFEFEAFTGAAGEAYAIEYCAFLKMIRELPPIDSIILNPDTAQVPNSPGSLYAISGALALRATSQNIDNVLTYLGRIPEEFQVYSIKDMLQKNPLLANTKAYTKWAIKNAGVIL